MPNGAVRPLKARLLCGRPASADAPAFVRCSRSCAVVQRRPILVLSCSAAVQKRAYGLGRIVQSVGRRTVAAAICAGISVSRDRVVVLCSSQVSCSPSAGHRAVLPSDPWCLAAIRHGMLPLTDGHWQQPAVVPSNR